MAPGSPKAFRPPGAVRMHLSHLFPGAEAQTTAEVQLRSLVPLQTSHENHSKSIEIDAKPMKTHEKPQKNKENS